MSKRGYESVYEPTEGECVVCGAMTTQGTFFEKIDEYTDQNGKTWEYYRQSGFRCGDHLFAVPHKKRKVRHDING